MYKEKLTMHANEKKYHLSTKEKWMLVLVAILFLLTTIK